jgi:hypothetical protein
MQTTNANPQITPKPYKTLQSLWQKPVHSQPLAQQLQTNKGKWSRLTQAGITKNWRLICSMSLHAWLGFKDIAGGGNRTIAFQEYYVGCLLCTGGEDLERIRNGGIRRGYWTLWKTFAHQSKIFPAAKSNQSVFVLIKNNRGAISRYVN